MTVKKDDKSKDDKKPAHWSKGITEIEKPETIEPFAPIIKEVEKSYKYDDYYGQYRVIAGRGNGSKKNAYALRIEEDLDQRLTACIPPNQKNSAINACIRAMLDKLEEENKMLIAK